MKKINKNLGLSDWDKKTIGHFFLGVGLTIFILTIVVFINISQYYFGNSLIEGFYITIISSIILMSYSLFNIFGKE